MPPPAATKAAARLGTAPSQLAKIMLATQKISHQVEYITRHLVP